MFLYHHFNYALKQAQRRNTHALRAYNTAGLYGNALIYHSAARGRKRSTMTTVLIVIQC